MNSVEQDGWLEISQCVRMELVKRLAKISEMEPEDLHSFIQALDAAEELEFNCQIRDIRMSRAKADLEKEEWQE